MSDIKPRGEPTEVEKVLAVNDRWAVAYSILHNRGIELRLRHGRPLALKQVEALAEVVKGWED